MFINIKDKGQNNFFYYLLGVLFVIVGVIVGQVPYGATISVLKLLQSPLAGELQNAMLKVQNTGIDNNWIFLFNLIPFVFALFALLLAVKSLHKRKVKTVITEAPTFRYKRFGFTALIWLILNTLSELSLYFIYPENYQFTLEFSRFIPLLVIALIFIPFQASFEEIFIRGYLLQAFTLWTKRPIFGIILSSLIFASLHLANPEIKEYGLVVTSYYFIFGLLAATIAYLDNGLEIPMAIHIINNLYGAVLVSYKDSVFSTPALFSVQRISLPVLMLISTLMVVVFFVIVKLKYKWKLKK